jgi:ABC-type sulfate/molybdate transport systems ATPase subunit
VSVRIGCRDLRVRVGARELLAVDALDVAAGETLAVIGPNGAGKSTLLRALGLLGRYRGAGQVLLDGVPATPAAMRAASAAVLQRPILRRGSVAGNVAAGLRLRGVGRREALRRSAPWLDALGIAHLAGRDARTLSGGEAQRASIARALAVQPRVLLLDEPFAGLDATTRTDLLADLRAVLDGLGAATLLVTHDRHEAHAMADRTALLVAGRIRQVGRTGTVLDHPADGDCARLLGFTVLAPVVTGRRPLLAARPEQCRPLLGDVPAPTGGVAVGGTLRRLVPLGGATRVDVETAAGLLACLCTDPPGARVGSRVTVVVEDGDLRALAAAPVPAAR